MVKTAIKVIRGGCGIKFTENGRVRHALKTPEDKPFMCEIEQAKRLVSLGVAEYVITTDEAEPVTQQGTDGDPDNTLSDQGTAGDNDGVVNDSEEKPRSEQLEAMTNKQLEKLAGELGADVKGCKKKADYIAVILAAESKADDEGVMDDTDGDPDNELPDLGAADPE